VGLAIEGATERFQDALKRRSRAFQSDAPSHVQRPAESLPRQRVRLHRGLRSHQEFRFNRTRRARGEEAKLIQEECSVQARRWVVERTHSWMNRFRRILVRWEKKPETTSRSCTSSAASLLARAGPLRILFAVFHPHNLTGDDLSALGPQHSSTRSVAGSRSSNSLGEGSFAIRIGLPGYALRQTARKKTLEPAIVLMGDYNDEPFNQSLELAC